MIIGNDFEAIMYIRNYQKSDLKSIIFQIDILNMIESNRYIVIYPLDTGLRKLIKVNIEM